MSSTDKSEAHVNANRWKAMVAAAMAVFMAALDMNALHVAMPGITVDFGADKVEWVAVGYMLAGVAAFTIAGRLSDRIGYRITILWGLAVFVGSSVLCGMAASLAQLIVFRVIQGIGGAFLTAPVMAIATLLFPDRERGRAMAIVGLVGPAGGIAGPGLGGLLTDAWGWSAIFFINVPVGLAAFWLLFRYLPHEGKKPHAKPDYFGTITLAAGILLLFFAFSNGSDRSSWYLLIAGIVFLFLFVLTERRVRDPILPPSVLISVRFSFPLAGILSTSAIGSGLGFVYVFFLQRHAGFSPGETGLLLLCVPLAMVAAAQVGGIVTDRFGPGLAAGAGAVSGLAGLVWLLPLDPHGTMANYIIPLLLIGFGQGLFASPANVAVMAATPRQYLGIGGAVANLVRQLGFALGPAFAAFFWSPEAPDSLELMRTVMYGFIGLQFLALGATFRFAGRRHAKPASG